MDEMPREITARLVFLLSADSNDPFHAPKGSSCDTLPGGRLWLVGGVTLQGQFQRASPFLYFVFFLTCCIQRLENHDESKILRLRIKNI